jgi:hypothetical protein
MAQVEPSALETALLRAAPSLTGAATGSLAGGLSGYLSSDPEVRGDSTVNGMYVGGLAGAFAGMSPYAISKGRAAAETGQATPSLKKHMLMAGLLGAGVGGLTGPYAAHNEKRQTAELNDTATADPATYKSAAYHTGCLAAKRQLNVPNLIY